MLGLVVAGCAGTQRGFPAADRTLHLTVRVQSLSEVSTFVGDVEEVAYSYTLRPAEEGRAFVAIGHDAQCPAIGDIVGRYRVGLERRRIPIGLREGQSEMLTSDLNIVSCEKLDVR